MKKICRILLALVAAVTLFGCKGQVENKEKEVFPKNNLSKTYIAMIELQKGAAKAGIEAVSKYVDIENLSSRSLTSDEAWLTEIGDYLPADLSTLKRTVEKDSRNAETEADIKEVEEITLQDELSAIVEQFNNSLEELIPNPEKALSLPFVSEAEDGLLIGDDMIIPFKSIEGAVTVELLNAMADGEDIELLLKDFEEDVESVFGFDSSSRSLWKTNTITWNKGVINYRWENISATHKQAVIDAMKEWSNKTGKISFKEIDDRAWTNFQLGISTIGCVRISDKFNNNRAGLSTIGYYGGSKAYLNLDPSIKGDVLTNTALHELGHVLGLEHEHQRYDRDNYLSLTSAQKQIEGNALIPKETSGFKWGIKAVRVGLWTIKVWYPIFWASTESETLGSFDFNSVMLYSGFDVISNKKYLNAGKATTVLNTQLSDNDIKMIKNKY